MKVTACFSKQVKPSTGVPFMPFIEKQYFQVQEPHYD